MKFAFFYVFVYNLNALYFVNVFMKVLKHIKNWWLGWDTNSDLEEKEIEIKDNVQECDGVEVGADSNKKCNVGKSTRFFDKIALLKLADSKKSEIAQQIINEIGTSENIVSAAHCATRLRLVIKSNEKVNKEADNKIAV